MVTDIEIVDDILYAGLEISSCAPGGCTEAGGIFRIGTGTDAWEQVSDAAPAAIAATSSMVYWTAPATAAASAPTLVTANVDTLEPAATPVSLGDAQSTVTGLAATASAVYAFVTDSEGVQTTLERSSLSVGSLPQAAQLVRGLDRYATGLAARADTLAWMELSGLVVADQSGRALHLATVAPSTSYIGRVRLSSNMALSDFESEGPTGFVDAICAMAFDGSERRLLAARDVDIVAVAANATHVFWSEVHDGGGPEANQLWVAPIGGGPARDLACEDSPIRGIAASDAHLYWISSELHHVDLASTKL